jgi:hypothetical protein
MAQTVIVAAPSVCQLTVTGSPCEIRFGDTSKETTCGGAGVSVTGALVGDAVAAGRPVAVAVGGAVAAFVAGGFVEVGEGVAPAGVSVAVGVGDGRASGVRVALAAPPVPGVGDGAGAVGGTTKTSVVAATCGRQPTRTNITAMHSQPFARMVIV